MIVIAGAADTQEFALTADVQTAFSVIHHKFPPEYAYRFPKACCKKSHPPSADLFLREDPLPQLLLSNGYV